MPLPNPQRGPGRPRGKFTQRQRFDTLLECFMQRPRGVTLEDIASLLHVSPRSARRYLDAVHQEVELEKVKGAREPTWRLLPQHRVRKIALRPMQIYAILASRGMFEGMRGSALWEEIEHANKDLLALARKPARASAAAAPDSHFEDRFLYIPEHPATEPSRAEDLDIVVNAAAELRPVSCRHRDASGRETRTQLHPYAIVLYADRLYLVARELPSDQVRVLPMHEVHDPIVSTTEHFELPADFTVAQYFPRHFGHPDAARKVRVVIDFSAQVAEAVRGRRFSPTQRFSNLRGGGVRLSMNVGDLSEVARWVLGFGDQARVVEPDALRERIMQELRGALSLYRERKA